MAIQQIATVSVGSTSVQTAGTRNQVNLGPRS